MERYAFRQILYMLLVGLQGCVLLLLYPFSFFLPALEACAGYMALLYRENVIPGRLWADYRARWISRPLSHLTIRTNSYARLSDQEIVLPMELIDLILEFVEQETNWPEWAIKATIGAVGLTCSALTPRSRAYLFKRISLSQNRAYSFVTLILSPHCTIPRRLKHIELYGDKPNQWMTAEAVLFELAGAGYTVQTLSLEMMHPFQHHKNFDIFKPLDITTLILKIPHASMVSIEEAVTFTSQFEHLEALRLQVYAPTRHRCVRLPAPTGRAAIQSLRSITFLPTKDADSSFHSAFLGYLHWATRENPPGLVSFEFFNELSAASARDVALFLREHAERIEHLGLKLAAEDLEPSSGRGSTSPLIHLGDSFTYQNPVSHLLLHYPKKDHQYRSYTETKLITVNSNVNQTGTAEFSDRLEHLRFRFPSLRSIHLAVHRIRWADSRQGPDVIHQISTAMARLIQTSPHLCKVVFERLEEWPYYSTTGQTDLAFVPHFSRCLPPNSGFKLESAGDGLVVFSRK